MSDQFDDLKGDRNRHYPDSDQRLKPARDHHSPSQPQRMWIAIAILAAVIGVGVWLLVTNTDDEVDDWPYDDQILEQESG